MAAFMEKLFLGNYFQERLVWHFNFKIYFYLWYGLSDCGKPAKAQPKHPQKNV